MTRIPTLLAGAALAALALPAAAQEAGGYGILMKTLANPFWGAMGEGAEEAAEEMDLSYFVQAAASDQAAEEQLNICNTMLQREPVAMVTAAINSTNLLPCLKAAQEAGTRVVDLDGNLDPAILEREGIEIAFSIGSDNVEAGGKGAAFMAERLGAEAEGAVLVIEGLSGNVTGQQRAQGFAETLAEMAPGLEIVASLPGDWDRGKAANITNDILTRNPDLVGIFAANDGMALGAVESVFAAGRGGDVVVIGVDGNSDAVQSIRDGRLTASVAQLPYLVGKQAVEEVARAVDGAEVEDRITVPTLVLTQDVLEAGEDPLLEFVR
jgi:D-allose transport system substrate-binding protein